MERGAVVAVRRHPEDVAAMAAGVSTRVAGVSDDGDFDGDWVGLAAGGDTGNLPGDTDFGDMAGDANSGALAGAIDAGCGDVGDFRNDAGTATEMVAPVLAERPPSQLLSLRTPVYKNSPSTRRPERELQEGKREREVGLKMGVDVGKTWPCMATHGARYIWRGRGLCA